VHPRRPLSPSSGYSERECRSLRRPPRDRNCDCVLRQAVNSWHTDVVAGTDLLGTSLEAKYAPKVFRHLQYAGEIDQKLLEAHQKCSKVQALQMTIANLEARFSQDALNEKIAFPDLTGCVADRIDLEAGSESCRVGYNDLQQARAELDQLSQLTNVTTVLPSIDDHQSPVRPQEYINLRLEQQVQFYKRRIPGCYRWRRFWELILGICALTSAALGYFFTTARYVGISTAVATAVTSLGAYSDLTKRIERYTSACPQHRQIEAVVVIVG